LRAPASADGPTEEQPIPSSSAPAEPPPRPPSVRSDDFDSAFFDFDEDPFPPSAPAPAAPAPPSVSSSDASSDEAPARGGRAALSGGFKSTAFLLRRFAARPPSASAAAAAVVAADAGPSPRGLAADEGRARAAVDLLIERLARHQPAPAAFIPPFFRDAARAPSAEPLCPEPANEFEQELFGRPRRQRARGGARPRTIAFTFAGRGDAIVRIDARDRGRPPTVVFAEGEAVKVAVGAAVERGRDLRVARRTAEAPPLVDWFQTRRDREAEEVALAAAPESAGPAGIEPAPVRRRGRPPGSGSGRGRGRGRGATATRRRAEDAPLEKFGGTERDAGEWSEWAAAPPFVGPADGGGSPETWPPFAIEQATVRGRGRPRGRGRGLRAARSPAEGAPRKGGPEHSVFGRDCNAGEVTEPAAALPFLASADDIPREIGGPAVDNGSRETWPPFGAVADSAGAAAVDLPPAENAAAHGWVSPQSLPGPARDAREVTEPAAALPFLGRPRDIAREIGRQSNNDSSRETWPSSVAVADSAGAAAVDLAPAEDATARDWVSPDSLPRHDRDAGEVTEPAAALPFLASAEEPNDDGSSDSRLPFVDVADSADAAAPVRRRRGRPRGRGRGRGRVEGPPGQSDAVPQRERKPTHFQDQITDYDFAIEFVTGPAEEEVLAAPARRFRTRGRPRKAVAAQRALHELMGTVRSTLDVVTTEDAQRDADRTDGQTIERSVTFVYVPKRVKPVSVTFILDAAAPESGE
jgi:hypothetical protein